ncbi:MAG: single-stranded DNA-binding protein [Clostridiales Family XIII bacterium]|jgi:single-strand DNA-binding protein|nr:single-stranded DNA-binding protein [Clostridiales Family XIII bacterium]
MNVVNLIGRLGKDPDIRVTESGLTIARFSIAIDRMPQKDGTKVTDWPNIVAFGKTAERISTYVKKGLKVAIEGRVQTGSYEDKDGKRVYTTEILANKIQFLDKVTKGQENTPKVAPQAAPPTPQAAPPIPQAAPAQYAQAAPQNIDLPF